MTEMPTYIVSGATGGIGQEIVRLLAQRGKARIILAVRNIDRAKAIGELYPDCEILPIKLDLSDFASVREASAQILAMDCKIDALINNAGIMPAQITLSADRYELATQVNYLSTRLFTELLAPAMAQGGAIVFTTSITRYLGKKDESWVSKAATHKGLGRRFYTYGMSKRMITRYARQLAIELDKRNIRVNCCDPGIADTGMITLGIPLVDKIANICFRPLIHSAIQGAKAALRAMDSAETAQIFTYKKQKANTL